MKKLLTVLFVFVGLFASAQKLDSIRGHGYHMKRGRFDSTAMIPTFCGVPTLRYKGLEIGAIAIDSCNNKFYFYNPKDSIWTDVTSGSTVDTAGRFVNAVTSPNDSTIVVCKGTGCTSYIIRGSPNTSIDTTGKFVNSVTFPTDSTAIVCKGGTCIQFSIKGGAGSSGGSQTDTTGKFVNSVVSNTDSTIIVCKAGTCIEYVIGSTIYVVNPLRYVDSSDGKRYLTIDTTGLGGGTPIDTANKWVTQILRRADSVFYVKGGTQTFAYKDSVGSGGSSTDSLDVVVQRGNKLLRDIRIFSPNGIDTVFVRDSTVYRLNFASNTLNNTQKAKLISRVLTEKYNTLDPAGKKQGHWSRYAISNNYNGGGSATHRQGLIFTEGYNISPGGSADLVGEGYFQTSLETDFGRKFEWYHQVGVDQPSRGHLDTRPLMFVGNKDTLLSEWAFRTTFIHAGPIDTAMDYFNTQNGQLTIDNVQGRTSPSAGNTTLRLQLFGSAGSISYNGTSMIFGGAQQFSFSNPLAPTLHNTYDLGNQSARWRKGFVQALQTSMTVVPDANYTLLISDETLSFKNITASRQLTLVNTFTGNTFITGTQITIITGQASFPVTFAGTTVKNIDGTTATSLPAGKSCVLKYDGTNWQVVSVSSGTL